MVIVVIRQHGKYLLTKRVVNDLEDRGFIGYWQIPGGGQEFGETLEETALREAKEELGLDVKIVTFIPRVFDSIRSYWHGLLHCYLCEMSDLKQSIVLNEEASSYRWFTPAQVKQLKSFPQTYLIIQEAEKLLLD